MHPTRTATVVVLVLALLAAAPPVEVATGAQIAITNVTTSPDRPGIGEVVTFRTTLRNAEGSAGDFEVTDVILRNADPPHEQLVRVKDLGSVPPGETIELPLSTAFSSPGVKELRVVVLGQDENNAQVSRQYPVTVVVADRGPQLSLDVADPVVGEWTQVNVTVSNGGTDAIRQLDVRLGGDAIDVDSPRRLVAELPAGQDRTFSYSASFTDAGDAEVVATALYATGSGQSRSVEQRETVTVDALVEDVAIDAHIADSGGATPPVVVDVRNFGNARLEDVSLRLVDGDRTVARRTLADVPAGEERTVRANVSGVRDAELSVVVAYETGGRTGEASTTLRYVSQPGRIVLTGVDYDRDGGVTIISGSASNVGLSAVDSVVLRVLPTEGVDPVAPNREYFVGTVPASDFVSFDLTARVAPNVTSVPIEVTYIADGVEHTETASVAYEPPQADGGQAGAGAGSGGPGLLGPALLVAIVIALGVGVLWWRRRRGGE